MSKVIVVGASGFVGSHVCGALVARGVDVLRVAAPRLPPMSASEAVVFLNDLEDDPIFTAGWSGAIAVVNAAGDPDASSTNIFALNAANGVLPGLLGRRAAEAAIPRFIHVSSAVVQGRAPMLDDTDAFDTFSTYARSKVLGEELARGFGPKQTVSYRPPSVHSESRRVTQLTAKIARSIFSTVAAPGTQHSPQALVENVGAAVAQLALCAEPPPRVVIHPWEGLSCAALLEVLGGRSPTKLPRFIARGVSAALRYIGQWVPNVAPNARRVEMLWFGQDQDTSWLTDMGWEMPVGLEGWERLRARLTQRDLQAR